MATLTKQSDSNAAEPVNAAVYDELIDLLARGDGPEAVIAFRSSEAIQERAYELVYLKRKRRLTDAEERELANFEEREHFVRMAKIRARMILREREAQQAVNGSDAKEAL